MTASTTPLQKSRKTAAATRKLADGLSRNHRHRPPWRTKQQGFWRARATDYPRRDREFVGIFAMTESDGPLVSRRADFRACAAVLLEQIV